MICWMKVSMRSLSCGAELVLSVPGPVAIIRPRSFGGEPIGSDRAQAQRILGARIGAPDSDFPDDRHANCCQGETRSAGLGSLFVEAAQLAQLLADTDFQATLNRRIEVCRIDIIRPVVFAGREATGFVV